MNEVGQWLLSIVAASVLCAVAEELMPSGSVKQVGKLVCGLVILWVLLAPLKTLGSVLELDWFEEYNMQMAQTKQELELQVETDRKAVIEEKCAAYIVDKAAELGVACTVEVYCRVGEEGLYLPEHVKLTGVFSDVAQSQMTQLLEEEFALASGQQEYLMKEETM